MFWDISPCNPLKVNQRFGESSNFSSQSMRMPDKKSTRGRLFFDPEVGGDIPPKRQLIF
jgi:hypothetical protein